MNITSSFFFSCAIIPKIRAIVKKKTRRCEFSNLILIFGAFY